MKSKLKAMIALAVLSTTLSMTAHAGPDASVCQTVANYAGKVAELRQMGGTEAESKKIITNEGVRRDAEEVIEFIYTMELDPTTARKMV